MHTELDCATCGIEVRWQPTIVDGYVFCCVGCAQGGPCKCDYDNLPVPDRVNPMVLQRLALTLRDRGRSDIELSVPGQKNALQR